MRNKLFFLNNDADLYIPLALSASFIFNLFYFHPFFYLFLIVIMVVFIQLKPLDSKFTQNIIFFCFPVIGAIANYHSICLTYNSIILFLWCRTYAVHKRILFKDVLTYFLIIGTWFIYWNPDVNFTIYAGGIMQGFMNPIHFLFLWSRFKIINWLVLIIPLLWALDNIFKFNQYFVALWDFEIFALYLLWLLKLNPEKVVKRVFLFSLILITFVQMYWDICPKMFPIN